MKAAVPDVEVIDADADPPPSDLRADVLFGGWGPHSLEYAARPTGCTWPAPASTASRPRCSTAGWSRTHLAPRPSRSPSSCSPRCSRSRSGYRRVDPRAAGALELRPARLVEHRLGLMGLGGIGLATAERALPFGMKVRALRRRPEPSPLEGVEVVGSIDELLPEADHLVLAAPATPSTRHLINAETLALVKPGVHLVNIARGALVDQDALRVALDDGRVAMATLDTVDPEPLPEGHWLYTTRRCGSAPRVVGVTRGHGAHPRDLPRQPPPLRRRRAGAARRRRRRGVLGPARAVALPECLLGHRKRRRGGPSCLAGQPSGTTPSGRTWSRASTAITTRRRRRS